MNKSTQIEILFDKKKSNGMLIGAGFFVAIGIIFMIVAPIIPHQESGVRIFIFAGGVLSASFFGIVLNSVLKKIRDNTPGIIINDLGFTDNSSGVSAGFVSWKDVLEIKITSMLSQQFLTVIVKNPQEYIDRETNSMKRFAMKRNLNLVGSPINISTNTLQTELFGLKQLFDNQLFIYKQGI